MNTSQTFIARLFLGHIFLLAGFSKIGAYAGTQSYMESMGVPGILLPLVILLEFGGGIAIIAGFLTRFLSYSFAAFSLVSGIVFHSNIADQVQMIMLMKNIAIAGGFLLLAGTGAGAWSVDEFLAKRKSPTHATA